MSHKWAKPCTLKKASIYVLANIHDCIKEVLSRSRVEPYCESLTFPSQDFCEHCSAYIFIDSNKYAHFHWHFLNNADEEFSLKLNYYGAVIEVCCQQHNKGLCFPSTCINIILYLITNKTCFRAQLCCYVIKEFVHAFVSCECTWEVCRTLKKLESEPPTLNVNVNIILSTPIRAFQG